MATKSIYDELATQPVFSSGSIISFTPKREISFELHYTHNDANAEKKTKSIEHLAVNPALFSPTSLSALKAGKKSTLKTVENVYEVSKDDLAPEALYLWSNAILVNPLIKASSTAPSGNMRALFFEQSSESSSNGNASKKTWIELWLRSTRVVVVTSEDMGTIYNDDSIGGISWNAAETSIAFIAERLLPKSDDPSQKYLYRGGDYGEEYSGRKDPALFVADFASKTIKAIDLDIIPFEVCHKPNSNDFLIVGIDQKKFPKKYGMFACSNRPTQLFLLSDGSLHLLSKDFESVQKVRVSPRNDLIFFLAGKAGGPHRSGRQLVSMNLTNFSTKVVVDLVGTPKPGDFPGLYINGDGLIRNPFVSANSNSILLTSVVGFRKAIFLVGLEDGSVIEITPKSVDASWTLLDVKEGYLVAIFSSMVTLPQVMIGKIEDYEGTFSYPIGTKPLVHWIFFSSPPLLPFSSSPSVFDWLGEKVQAEILRLPSIKTDHEFEAMLLYPRDLDSYCPHKQGASLETEYVSISKLPLVVSAHGGPHVAWTAEWSKSIAFLISLGMAVVLVNYSGSTGYGEDSLYRLIGRIGSLDVEETHIAAKHIVDNFVWIDSSRVFLFGGSHGGFVNAHLTLAYPEFYRGIISRNPATDLILNAGVSDIPEWSFFEAGLEFSFEHLACPTDPSLYEKLYMHLPISRTFQKDKKHPKCLIILGDKDVRVPNCNGLRWHERLLSYQIPSVLYILPGTGHSLDGVSQEAAQALIVAEFILNNK